ncbi:hypothetical protein PoB_003477100 [Plakobranchus ocellatus]|uniref:Transmembrane 9 superfamily member n=1 Tax=Plakobranchus ocellatus TaxID=259542 RepID=A0AAV4ANW2_9GAST|nr:hypothetical protein PoB_003477100 [Plakobranchus ocellatus]
MQEAEVREAGLAEDEPSTSSSSRIVEIESEEVNSGDEDIDLGVDLERNVELDKEHFIERDPELEKLESIVFGVFFLLNLVLWAKSSSAAVPFSTLIALLALWFGISVPLTFVGAYFGIRKGPIKHPTSTHQIPLQIPDQSMFTRPIPGIIMGGVLPFGCIFIQLFFILNSIWCHQIYYMFGFLFLVFILLILTCSEVTIVLCYFHLCAEDYRWWWRSFLTSGSTAIYFFFYCMYFFFTKLEMSGFVNTLLYFGYMGIIVFLFFITTGLKLTIVKWFGKATREDNDDNEDDDDDDDDGDCDDDDEDDDDNTICLI